MKSITHLIFFSIVSIACFGQTELIQNGGFEIPNGQTGSIWTNGGSQGVFTFGNQSTPHSGTCYAYSSVGGFSATNMFNWIEQTITIPANATSANVSFWYSAYFGTTATSVEYLRFYLFDVNLNAVSSVDQVFSFSSSGNIPYTILSTSIPSSLFGKPLKVVFVGKSGSVSSLYRVDDVSLTYTAPSCSYPIASFTPSQTSITAGGSITTTNNSTGSPTPNYYWSVSPTNGVSPTTSTTPNPSFTFSSAGTYTLSLTASNTCGSSNAPPSTITVNNSCNPATISSSPINSSGTVGGSTSFTCSVNGTSPYTYTWEYNSGSGWLSLTNSGYSTWTNGGSSSTLTLSNLTLAMNNYQYRCKISNNCSSNVLSNGATLTVSTTCTPPTSPTSASASQTTINAGQTSTLQVNGGALNSATDWVWYTGNCGGTQIGQGTSINVLPSATTTYYVQASACGVSTICRSVPINVNSASNTPTVTVLYPNGGETLYMNQNYNLSANIIGGYNFAQYHISYDGGTTWNLITPNDNNNSGNSVLNWTPSYLPFPNCKIKTTVFYNGGSVFDISNANFSIVQNPNYTQEFCLTQANSISHLFWPFESSSWQTKNGWSSSCGDGCGGHTGSDYYSQDWAALNCQGTSFYSPLSGTIVWMNGSCIPNCYNSTTGNCSNPLNSACVGNCKFCARGVLIQSDINPNMAFKVCHLQETNSSISLGTHISVGQELGKIGNRGCSSSAHAHCTLYKNINNIVSGTSTFLDLLKLPSVYMYNSTYNLTSPFKASFKFDAISGLCFGLGTGSGGNEISPNGITNFYICGNNDSIVLNAPTGYSKYFWSTNDTTSSIVVKTIGKFAVNMLDFQGNYISTDSFSVFRYEDNIEVVSENGLSLLCNGSPLNLYPFGYSSGDEVNLEGGSEFIYNWSNGSNLGSISITNPGNYSVTVSNHNGCVIGVDSIDISSASLPQIPIISTSGNTLASSTCSGCTYQWKLNGNPVAFGQYINTDTIGSGFYTVVVTNINGCSNESDPFAVTTGVDELSNLGISIFPNPAQNSIYISATESTNRNIRYELVSVIGSSLVSKAELNTSATERIDLSNYASGIYFLKLYVNGQLINYKFIKE